MKLPPGKIPLEILEQIVFRNLGATRKEVALGPAAGIDGAVINVADKSLVVSMDPITGATERIGWLAVNVNANDVATFGVEPAFYLSCVMLPEKSDVKILTTISAQMNKAAKALGVAIIGGHCESTPELHHPIVVGCAMGMTKKDNYVTAGGAKPSDKLILTKTAGIEGTAILASDMEPQLKTVLNARVVDQGKMFFDHISIVKDALTAFQTGGVHAMHDPTEGGILGGVYEMTKASNLGIRISEKDIPVRRETKEICFFFKIDPLRLVSSGALLVAAKPSSAKKIVENLINQGIMSSVIGEFVQNVDTRVLITKKGKRLNLDEPLTDHLWLALKRGEHST